MVSNTAKTEAQDAVITHLHDLFKWTTSWQRRRPFSRYRDVFFKLEVAACPRIGMPEGFTHTVLITGVVETDGSHELHYELDGRCYDNLYELRIDTESQRIRYRDGHIYELLVRAEDTY